MMLRPRLFSSKTESNYLLDTMKNGAKSKKNYKKKIFGSNPVFGKKYLKTKLNVKRKESPQMLLCLQKHPSAFFFH